MKSQKLATVVYLEATTHHAQMGSAIAKLVTQAQPATHASMAILQMLDLVQVPVSKCNQSQQVVK